MCKTPLKLLKWNRLIGKVYRTSAASEDDSVRWHLSPALSCVGPSGLSSAWFQCPQSAATQRHATSSYVINNCWIQSNNSYLKIRSKSESVAVAWKGQWQDELVIEGVRAGCFADREDPVDREQWTMWVKWQITKRIENQCQAIHNCPVFQLTDFTQLLPV